MNQFAISFKIESKLYWDVKAINQSSWNPVFTIDVCRILIVLNIDIVTTDVDSKIGAPTTLEMQAGGNTSSPSTKQEPSNQSSFSGPVQSSGFSSGSGANMQLEASLTPIKNLNPYQTRWTIKARITQKSAIKKWHNAKGDGQLFSVNLLDQTVRIMHFW